MKKALLCALATTAGCAVGGEHSEAVVHTPQITTAMTVDTPNDDEPGELRNLPKRRFVPPSNGGGDSTTGGGTSVGGDASPWQPLKNQPPIYAGTSLLLTDGGVMVQDVGSSNWWKLTPDLNGSYVNGTWTPLASMPDGYAPLYFASAVLPDGRVVVEGGEYQAFEPAWTTRGAIYDPTRDQWTPIAPPAGWSYIGDAQSVVLADGRFVVASCCSNKAASLDPTTLTWTPFGSGKVDINDEEGWTLLQTGGVLTVDANNPLHPTASEILTPDTGLWTSAGSTVVRLADTTDTNGGSHEMGPAMVRPDGSVFATGATGHTAIYHPWFGTWSAGPDFPSIAGEGQLDVADGPAALLPNGDVLVVASAGIFNAPAHVFKFDGSALTEVSAPPSASQDSSFNTNLLLLPTGEVLFTDFSNDVEIYTPSAPALPSRIRDLAPRIQPACDLGELTLGTTHRIDGTGLNGLSQAVAYGDDAQAATNYPLVRIKNVATGHVVYARTHDHGSMAIGRGIHSGTSFDVPMTAETGRSELTVVANGIASDPLSVFVSRTAHTLGAPCGAGIGPASVTSAKE